MLKKPKAKVPVYLPFHAFWIRLTLLLLLATGVYFFHSFAKPIIIAFIIAILTWPFYTRLLSYLGNKHKTAASLATLAAVIFLVTPLSLLTSYTIKEVIHFLGWAVNANTTGIMAPDWFASIPWAGEWLAEKWNEHLSAPGMIGEITQVFGSQNIGSVYRNVIATSGSILHIFLTLTFTLITLFFLYKDGNNLIGQLDKAGEYSYPERWNRYSRVIPLAIRSTVLGMGVIAVAEGVILGVAYWLAGFPSPVIMGIVTGFMALIPGGAPLSFTLVSLYLVATGNSTEGILLFIWGAFELFMVDKFIRPRLVGGPMQLPFLPTFFGLVGGVKTMGFLGLFIGPALMVILVMLWREFIQDLTEIRARKAERELEGSGEQSHDPAP